MVCKETGKKFHVGCSCKSCEAVRKKARKYRKDHPDMTTDEIRAEISKMIEG